MLPIWLYWDKPDTCPSLIRIFHKLVILNNPNLDVRILDAESVKKYVSVYPDYYKNLCPAHQADYIRLRLLFDHGGLWLDSDILCMDSLKPYLDDIERHGLVMIAETDELLTNSFLGSTKGHPFIDEWIRKMSVVIEEKKGNIEWCDIGSHVMMSIYKENKNGICNGARVYLAYKTFYNIPWQECKDILLMADKGDFDKYYYKGQRLLITVNSLYKELKNSTVAEILCMKDTILYEYLQKAIGDRDISRYFTDSELLVIQYNQKNAEKLQNIPPFYYINLDRHRGRNDHMLRLFDTYNIGDYTRVRGCDGRNDPAFYIPSECLLDKEDENPAVYGCTSSHIKAIQRFYEESDANAAIICEDDLACDYLDYWNGNFNEMLVDLPWNFDCCLLTYIKAYGDISTKLEKYKYGHHLSTVCYLISRKGAKKLLDKVRFSKKGKIDFRGVERPAADWYLYEQLDNVYAIPLFTYLCSDSSIHPSHLKYQETQKALICKAWQRSINSL